MNYVGEVTSLLRSRWGETKILSPMDYVIIAEWEKQEIPLAVVIGTITELCDQMGDKAPFIDSICYFQDTVKQNFRSWLETESGTV